MSKGREGKGREGKGREGKPERVGTVACARWIAVLNKVRSPPICWRRFLKLDDRQMPALR